MRRRIAAPLATANVRAVHPPLLVACAVPGGAAAIASVWLTRGSVVVWADCPLRSLIEENS
jgi:hypothetical protein